jgi:hypothetical protein
MSHLTKNQPVLVDRAEGDALDLREIAAGYVDEAFASARHDGLDEDAVAHAALTRALAELVAMYGEDATAIFAESLSEKVRNGVYSETLRH